MSTRITGLIDAKQTVRAVGEAQPQPAVRPVATRHNYKKVKWRKNHQRRTRETMLSTTKNPLKISDAINIPDSTHFDVRRIAEAPADVWSVLLPSPLFHRRSPRKWVPACQPKRIQHRQHTAGHVPGGGSQMMFANHVNSEFFWIILLLNCLQMLDFDPLCQSGLTFCPGGTTKIVKQLCVNCRHMAWMLLNAGGGPKQAAKNTTI